MSSFTVERVTQVVLGARQEVEKARVAHNVEEWKGDMLCKELDNLGSILKVLVACTDVTTTQSILKLIFARAKDVWVNFKNEQQHKPSTPTAVSTEFTAIQRSKSVEDGVREETPEERRKREEAEKKAKEENEWRERTLRIKKEREEREKEANREREEREAREKYEKALQEERQREQEAKKRREYEEELKKDKERKEKQKKKEKKTKRKAAEAAAAAQLPKLNTQVVVVDDDLGLTDTPLKDKKHQEWDSEIRRLNNVVNEKIMNMEKRRSRRMQVAGSMMIPSSRSRDSPGLETIFQNSMAKSTPAFTLEGLKKQPTPAPYNNTSSSASSAQPAATKPAVNSRISAAASIFEKSSSPSQEKVRPQSMMIRPSTDTRPSASVLAQQMDVGNKAKITEAIQKAGKEATTAAQLLLKKEEADNAALNSAIRMMVINFKSCTEYLDSPSQKQLKDDILDVSMNVLLKTKDYLTSPDQTKKGLLVKEVARALTIIKDYNQNA